MGGSTGGGSGLTEVGGAAGERSATDLVVGCVMLVGGAIANCQI